VLDIDVAAANNFMIQFLRDEAEKKKNGKWLKQISLLEGVEINDANLFQKRAKLLSNAGGIISNKKYRDIFLSTIKNMLFTKEYKFADIIKTIRGIEFCQNVLLPEFNSVNLFERIERIHTAVHFMQGMKDAVAPNDIAVRYFEYLKCNTKTFTEFKESAHMPHLEEPGKFADVAREKIYSAGPPASNGRFLQG